MTLKETIFMKIEEHFVIRDIVKGAETILCPAANQSTDREIFKEVFAVRDSEPLTKFKTQPLGPSR